MQNTFVEQGESEIIVAHVNEKYCKTYSKGSGDGSVLRKEEGKGEPHQRASLAQSFSFRVSLLCCVCVCACVVVVVTAVILVALSFCQWEPMTVREVMATLRRGARKTDRCMREARSLWLRVVFLTAGKSGLAKFANSFVDAWALPKIPKMPWRQWDCTENTYRQLGPRVRPRGQPLRHLMTRIGSCSAKSDRRMRQSCSSCARRSEKYEDKERNAGPKVEEVASEVKA